MSCTESASLSKIGLTDQMTEHISGLYMNKQLSDVTFCVENVSLPAHKVVLAAYDYFRALLCGDLVESTQNVIKLDVGVKPFKAIIKYIYFGYISLVGWSYETIFEILQLADMFLITVLADSIEQYLKRILAPTNVLKILELSRFYKFEHLMEACFVFADRCATEVLLDVSFQNLLQGSLCDLLKRDTFSALEIDIFVAVQGWLNHNADADIELVMPLVRLPLLNLDQLITVVKPSAIVDPKRLLNLIEQQHFIQQIKQLQNEIATKPNVASSVLGSKVIHGVNPKVLLNANKKGFTSHIIQKTGITKGIVIELGTISTINYIELLLDSGSYAYVVEVSKDNICYERMVDHSTTFCCADQQLYIPVREIRFIRLLGITSNRYDTEVNGARMIFCCRQLTAKHIQILPRIRNMFVMPSINVANVNEGMVTKGENRCQRIDIQPTIVNIRCKYLEFKFKKHILIQLNQPYFIGSMRLRLYDLDNQTYSFSISVSPNMENFEKIFYKSEEDTSSCQTINFEPRVVSFISILNIHSFSAQEFRLVHFECPAQLVPPIARMKS